MDALLAFCKYVLRHTKGPATGGKQSTKESPMATEIFVNITTTDLQRARGFYEGIGWSINPMFSDENAICVIVDERIYLMVLTRDFFATFTKKQLPDPHTHS